MLTPALVYLPGGLHRDPDLSAEKHAKHCLKYADAKGWRIVATASRSDAVVDAARAGLVGVVLVACRWRDSHLDEIEPTLVGLGVRLVVIRDSPNRRRVEANPVAARLAAMGLSAEQIAEALGVTVEQAYGVVEQAARADRRPGPNHPWRRPGRSNVVDLGERRSRRAG